MNCYCQSIATYGRAEELFYRWLVGIEETYLQGTRGSCWLPSADVGAHQEIVEIIWHSRADIYAPIDFEVRLVGARSVWIDVKSTWNINCWQHNRYREKVRRELVGVVFLVQGDPRIMWATAGRLRRGPIQSGHDRLDGTYSGPFAKVDEDCLTEIGKVDWQCPDHEGVDPRYV